MTIASPMHLASGSFDYAARQQRVDLVVLRQEYAAFHGHGRFALVF